MRLSRTLTPFVVLAAVLGARTPRPATSGTIDGLVTDSSLAPIGGATVTILQSAVQVETDPSGHFKILQVPGGQYLLVVRKVGYHPVSGIVEVDANEGVRLAYTMNRLETVLDTMRVVEQRLSMKMTEFDARRKRGEAHFITQDEIERRNVPAVSDLVRGVLGFKLAGLNWPHRIVSSRIAGHGCLAEVFVDGIRQTASADDSSLPSPKDIAGIELYPGPSAAPLQYGRIANCGVVLIWTRDGAR